MCECFIHTVYGAGKLYLVLCVTGHLHFSLFLHYSFSLFPKRQILDSFKFKEFADDNFKFNKNGRKFSKQVENTVGKGEIACYEQFLLFPQFITSSFSFSNSVFIRLVSQGRLKVSLCGNGLTLYQTTKFYTGPVAHIIISVYYKIENTVGKRRKCWLPGFFLFPQCFQKVSLHFNNLCFVIKLIILAE